MNKDLYMDYKNLIAEYKDSDGNLLRVYDRYFNNRYHGMDFEVNGEYEGQVPNRVANELGAWVDDYFTTRKENQL